MNGTDTIQALIAEIEQNLSGEITIALADFQRQLLDLFPGEIEQIISSTAPTPPAKETIGFANERY
jgi:hypothetical protein